MKQACHGEDELRQTEDEREDKDHLIPSITSATRCACWRGESTAQGGALLWGEASPDKWLDAGNLFLCAQHPINLSLLLSP